MTESSLAPLIDRAMRDNAGIYMKSHPTLKESTPHIEIHLTITAEAEQKPFERLQQAVKNISSLIQENGGKIINL